MFSRTHCSTYSVKAKSGFSFIEVLIAVLIFSLAVVPTLNLSNDNQKTLSLLQQHNQVQLILSNLAKRVWLNQQHILELGEGSVYFNSDNATDFNNMACENNYCLCSDIPSSIPNCEQNTCDSAQIASFDLFQVHCQLSKILYQFELILKQQSSNNGLMDLLLTVVWSNSETQLPQNLEQTCSNNNVLSGFSCVQTAFSIVLG